MAGFGLKIVRSNGPEGFVGNQIEFPISPSNTAPIFTGDPVRLSSGFIVEATGAANNVDFTPLGVFQGCVYTKADGTQEYAKYWDGAAGRTNIRALVAMPNGATFLIKGSSALLTQANIGSRYGIAYTAGSTIYGDSRSRLSAASGASAPFLLHRLVDAPFNAFTNAEPLFEVSFIRTQFGSALV